MAKRKVAGNPDLTQERLKSILHYDPETGVFTWRIVTPNGAGQVGKKAGVPTHNGYESIVFEYEKYLAHRLAWFYVTGEWPVGDLDHADRDRSNNRFKNLRPCSRSNNRMNSGVSVRNTSGVKGVRWNKFRNRWTAVITKNYKIMHVGHFKEFDDAVAARRDAELRLFGEFSIYHAAHQ